MLKRVVIIVLLYCSIAFGASGFVVGLSGGVSMLQSSEEYYNNYIEIDWYEGDKNNTTLNYGLKFGYDAYFVEEQAIRIYFDYNRNHFIGSNDMFKKASMDLYLLNADYRYDFLAYSFGIFGGINIGYVTLNTNNSYGDHNSMGFGLNAGLVYQPLEFLELEFKFRLVNTNFPNKQIPVTIIDATRQTLDADTPYQFILGLNFKF